MRCIWRGYSHYNKGETTHIHDCAYNTLYIDTTYPGDHNSHEDNEDSFIALMILTSFAPYFHFHVESLIHETLVISHQGTMA